MEAHDLYLNSIQNEQPLLQLHYLSEARKQRDPNWSSNETPKVKFCAIKSLSNGSLVLMDKDSMSLAFPNRFNDKQEVLSHIAQFNLYASSEIICLVH